MFWKLVLSSTSHPQTINIQNLDCLFVLLYSTCKTYKQILHSTVSLVRIDSALNHHYYLLYKNKISKESTIFMG